MHRRPAGVALLAAKQGPWLGPALPDGRPVHMIAPLRSAPPPSAVSPRLCRGSRRRCRFINCRRGQMRIRHATPGGAGGERKEVRRNPVQRRRPGGPPAGLRRAGRHAGAAQGRGRLDGPTSADGELGDPLPSRGLPGVTGANTMPNGFNFGTAVASERRCSGRRTVPLRGDRCSERRWPRLATVPMDRGLRSTSDAGLVALSSNQGEAVGLMYNAAADLAANATVSCGTCLSGDGHGSATGGDVGRRKGPGDRGRYTAVIPQAVTLAQIIDFK